MKKLFTAVAAAALAITTTPVFANSSWVDIGSFTSGSRSYIQKHNWQGRYRVYGSIRIRADGERFQFVNVADCGSWVYRFSDETQWTTVLPGTMADAELQYVCN